MTAQIPERLVYGETQFDIIGVHGDKLFSPEDFGVHTSMMHTACYRGYHSIFRVTQAERDLRLDHITANCDMGNPIAINGVMPIIPARPDDLPDNYYFNPTPVYENVNLKIPFTGGLLLGADFLQSHYVHMGFQKPFAFKIVTEMLFEDGNLTDVFDHSEKAVEAREQLEQSLKDEHAANPGGPDISKIEEFVQHAFSLDYRNWWV